MGDVVELKSYAGGRTKLLSCADCRHRVGWRCGVSGAPTEEERFYYEAGTATCGEKAQWWEPSWKYRLLRWLGLADKR
jgi:hypothetical protein